jgi:hypothetical protein
MIDQIQRLLRRGALSAAMLLLAAPAALADPPGGYTAPQASHANHREHAAVLQRTGAGSEFTLLRPPRVLETV